MHTVMALALVLRVFDRSGDSVADRREAIETADAILRAADVTATWVDCSRGSRAAAHAMCTDPLGSGERVIRITPGPPETQVADRHPPAAPGETRQRPLGHSLVEPEIGGTLATVFSDRVEWLAKASRAPYPLLLGRAMAHEIGHLLMGTNEHAVSGLMRAVWTAAELAHDDRQDWAFTTEDRARLSRSRVGQDQWRLAERAATPPEKDES